MSIFTSRPALRWAVPVTAALAIVGTGLAARTLATAAEPDLPPRSAAQLLVDLQTARLDGLSGTVVQRADLGLPALGGGSSGSSELSSLISGKHTLRVWYSGPDKARVALLGTNGETDIIYNGTDAWIWSSAKNEATHYTGLASTREGKDQPKLPDNPASALPKTPQEAADLALRAIEPTTRVTTGRSAEIAGRAAYELVLSPRDTDSLIGQVRLAVDAEHHVPLRVQVLAKGAAKAALEVGFTQVSFVRPDAAQFTFTPPPGTTVTERALDQSSDTPRRDKDADGPKPVVVGTGWTSVLVLKLPEAPATPPAGTPNGRGGSPLGMFGLLAPGTVLRGSLFTVMFTEDRRVLIGAVSADRLAKVAADPAAQPK